MKRIVLIVFIIVFSSCKTDKKKNENTDAQKVGTSDNEVISEIGVGEIDTWELRGLGIVKTNEIYLNGEIYNMQVVDHEESYSFAAINNIKIAYTGGRYRVTFIAKAPKETDNFGIRIQEVYPNRFDAVFDLNKEEVRGIFQEGDFIDNPKVNIEAVGDGWFKCTIDAEIYASYFRLAFGPTNVPKGQTNAWEADSLNDKNRQILIILNSIKIEELDS